MANLILYTIKYKNYFDRRVLREDTLADYLDYLTAGHLTSGVSFIQNDNIDTKQVVNYNPDGDDYAILVKEENGESTIISRWFITEAVQERTGQFMLNLKRDVIVDHYEDIKNAPIFVQKGMLSDEDGMICNDEGILFNKIKKNEIPLRDGTGCAWLVAYISQETPESKTINFATSSPVSYVTSSQIANDTGLPASDIEALVLGTKTLSFCTGGADVRYAEAKRGVGSKTIFEVKISKDWNGGTPKYYSATGYNQDYLYYFENSNPYAFGGYELGVSHSFKNALDDVGYKKILDGLKNKSTPVLIGDLEALNKLMAYNGRIILISGNYYEISLFNQSSSNINQELIYNENSDVTDIINSLKNELLSVHPSYYNELTWNSNGKLFVTLKGVTELKGTKVLSNAYTGSLVIPTTKNACKGIPFDMVAIPFGQCHIGGEVHHGGFAYYDIVKETTSDKKLLLEVAKQMIIAYGSALYDMQLLPYCPMQDYIRYDAYYEPLDMYGSIDTRTLVSGVDWSAIVDSNSNVLSYAFYPKTNSFTIPRLGMKTNGLGTRIAKVDNMKVASQTTMLRLVSPNYQGMFDFNIAKNGGSVDFFLADCTYKPFTPYIRVAPQFGFLYGTNYGDSRGLICGGDFSMSQTSNAFVQYELQNKNYINIFNREMQTLELEQNYQRVQQAFQVAGGTVAGGVAGAITGAKAGPYGAIAGAVVGAGAGAIGGAIDVQMSEQMRRNTKDYAQDRFNYTLGNVQALPNSLTKVSTFNINSKVFPFIEEYECTEEEKQSLIDKITYDGMTVQRIGKMVEFESGDAENFFKGQLIRCTELHEDTHLFNTIYDELMKGVYI